MRRAEAIREGVRRKRRGLGQVGDGSSENVNVPINARSSGNESITGSRKIGVFTGSIDEVHLTISINDKASGKCI